MAQEPFSMISPLEQNRKLPKRLVMKVLLYPFFCNQPCVAQPPSHCTLAGQTFSLMLIITQLCFCEFSPNFFFPVASVHFSFILVPPDVLSTSNYFCLPKNRDWMVLWASAVRFMGWENTPKKHNKRELALWTLAVEFSHRILWLWAFCFSLQIWCHTF